MKNISYFDLTCILLFFSFAFAVYKKGFVKEVFSKLSWIVAALIAFTLTSTVGMGIAKKIMSINSPPLLYLISFVVIFVISYVIIKMIGSFVDTVTNLPILNELNRALGIVLGLLEAAIIIAFIVELLLLQEVLPREVWMKNSKIAPFFIQYILQMNLEEILPIIDRTIPTIKV